MVSLANYPVSALFSFRGYTNKIHFTLHCGMDLPYGNAFIVNLALQNQFDCLNEGRIWDEKKKENSLII